MELVLGDPLSCLWRKEATFSVEVKDSGASSGSMANLPSSSSILSPLAIRKSINLPQQPAPSPHDKDSSTTTATPVTLADVGSTVYISGVQSGILRFYGETQFKPGIIWCGIELPLPQGTHDGGVDGVRYFKAKKNCGIFAPVEKVTLRPESPAAAAGENSQKVVGGSSTNRRFSLGPSSLSRENSCGSNGKEMSGSLQLQTTPPSPPAQVPSKGSKRPKSVLESEKTFTVAKTKATTSLTEQKKRRKLEESSQTLDNRDQNTTAAHPSLTPVRVPNFAEINELNLREEMERSAASESSESSLPLTPAHSSTPRGNRVGFGGGGSTAEKVFPLQLRRPSMIKTPTDVLERLVLTPPPKTATSSAASGSRTYVVYSDRDHQQQQQHQPYQYQYHHQLQQSTACRPTSLGLDRGASEEEEPPSEASSSDTGGLFGQKTPELWDGDGASLAGLSSPEEAGIQEESSLGLGLTTPSLFESWGDLKEDELELYQHLRSPSIDNYDNLDFDEEEEDTHNALEEHYDLEDPMNNTVIQAPAHNQGQQEDEEEEKPEKTDPIKQVSPTVEPSIDQNDCDHNDKTLQINVITPPQTETHRHQEHDPHQHHHHHDQERCDSSVISAASGYDAQTDSDFNTESEADHEELLLSHPTHTAPNKNRNARVIDGALYTSTTTTQQATPPSSTTTTTTTIASSTSSQQQTQITTSTSISISASEEPESSSSGFYSSSESGSLTRGGSRHPSNSHQASASGSDCESSSNSTNDGSNSNNEAEAENEVTLHNSTSTTMSTTTDVDGGASSTITTERNSPEEVDVGMSPSLGQQHRVHNISHSYEDGLDIDVSIGEEDGFLNATFLDNNKKQGARAKKALKDENNGRTLRNVTIRGRDSIMNRSQSVSCISSASSGVSSHGYNTRFKFVGSRGNKEKVVGIGNNNTGTNSSATTTTTTSNTTNKTRVKGKHSSVLADTVASSSRRVAAVAAAAAAAAGSSVGHLGIGLGHLGGVSGRLGGSTRSLTSSTSNLTSVSSKSPGIGRKIGGGVGKWDSVMAKINEGKGKREINVKEVRAKVFDRLIQQTGSRIVSGGSSTKGSTSSLVGVGVGSRKKPLRTENSKDNNKDVENEPVSKKGSGGEATKGTNSSNNNKRGVIGGMLQRTDSTSSEGSEHHGNNQRPQFTTKHRPKKENGPPRRQISDVSTASECSGSHSNSTSATQPTTTTGSMTPQSKSKTLKKATATILERPSSSTSSSTTTNVVASKTSGSGKGSTRVLSATATATATSGSTSSTTTPQLKSPHRISPASLKTKKTTTSSASTITSTTTNTTASTKLSSGVETTASNKDNKGQSTKNVTSARSVKSQQDPVKPLRDHNRITTKSKEVGVTNSRSRRRDDIKDKESTATVESSQSLREQLSRLKIQLERAQSEDLVNKEEIQKLSTFVNQSVEERARLGQELVECSKKVEAMTIVVRHTEEKNTSLTTSIADKNAAARQLEVLLQVAEEKTKQIPVLSGQLTAVHGIHRGELRNLKRDYKVKVEKLVEEHVKELDSCKESLKSYYDDKLAEKEKELEQVKETHRLEMESYSARHLNGSPHDVLLKDIASMSAVIEMQNQRVKELQTRVQILTMKEEELIKSENLSRTLSARVEDLEAQINQNKNDKCTLLAQLTESELALADAVGKNKSLVQNVDELTFKLNHPDIVPASPSACSFKESNHSNNTVINYPNN